MKIIHWLIATVAILIAAYLLPGVTVTLIGAIVLAVVLGVINAFMKPLVMLLTLPINILTLGLFSLVINAGFVMGAAYLIPDFEVDGFLTAVAFSIVLALLNAFLLPRRREVQ